MENGKKEYKRKDFYTASLIYSGYIRPWIYCNVMQKKVNSLTQMAIVVVGDVINHARYAVCL